MEIFIAVFIGLWLVAASLISYFWLKWDYKQINDDEIPTQDAVQKSNETISDVKTDGNISVDCEETQDE